MKKLVLALGVLFFSNNIVKAQDVSASDTTFKVEEISNKKKKNTSNSSAYSPSTDKVNRDKQPSDHILIQFGSESWMNKPSNITTSGGRFFNLYFMNDKPFKTNPKFSVAYGIGLGTSNIYFDKMYVDLKSNASTLPFINTSNDSSWNKFKVTSIFLEIPVELRFNINHLNPTKSWKFAVGAKVGTILKGYSKGVDLRNKNGVSVFDKNYIRKESDKTFFSKQRITLTARAGYGNFTLHTAYTINPVFISGSAPEMNSFQIGLSIGGL